MAETTRPEQRSLQDQLKDLQSQGLRGSDKSESVAGDSVQSGAMPDAQQDSVLTKEEANRLMEAIQESSYADTITLNQEEMAPKVAISPASIEIIHKLVGNDGKHLRLAGRTGTEIEVWYDGSVGKFFRQFVESGKIGSFAENRLGYFIDSDTFKEKPNLLLPETKIILNQAGDQSKESNTLEATAQTVDAAENSDADARGENIFKKEPATEITPIRDHPEMPRQVSSADNAETRLPEARTTVASDPFVAFEKRLRVSNAFEKSPRVVDKLIAAIDDARQGRTSLEDVKKQFGKHYGFYSDVKELILADLAAQRPPGSAEETDHITSQSVQDVVAHETDVKTSLKADTNVDENISSVSTEDALNLSTPTEHSVSGEAVIPDIEKVDTDSKDTPLGKEQDIEQRESSLDAADANIEKLQEAMALARQEYAQMDYKKTTAWDSMKRFFGKSLSKDEDQDVIEMQAQYQNATMDYTNARLAQVRERSATQEELKRGLVEVLREIEMQERVHLYDARVTAKIPNWAVEKTQGAVDWYRGLSFTERLAFSAILIAGGATAGVAFGAGAAGAAFLARRGFGGAVAGRGIFQLGETLSQKSSQKEMDASMLDAQKEMAFTENSDDIMRQLQERLDASIGNIDTKLNDMMQNRTRSTVAGFAIGAFLSFGAPQYLMDKFQAGLGGSDAIQETVANHVEKVVQTPVSPQAVFEKVPEMIPVEKTIELTIQPGSGQGIEGQLIQHLIGNGHDKLEAGKMAHRMVLDYVHDHVGMTLDKLHHVVGGEKILLAADGLGIEDITKATTRLVGEHASAIHSKITESVAHHAALSGVEAVAPTSFESLSEVAPLISTEVSSESSNPFLMPVAVAAGLAAETLGGSVERVKPMIVLRKMVHELSGNSLSQWNEIKNMTFEQLQNDNSGTYIKTLDFIKKYAKYLGTDMPKGQEDQPMKTMVIEIVKAYVKKENTA